MRHPIANLLFLLNLCFALANSEAAHAAPTLVQPGKASAVIVLPDQASPPETLAAEELVEAVFRMTGARLEVLTETQAAEAAVVRSHVYLGNTTALARFRIQPGDIPTGGFLTRIKGRDLAIVGDDAVSPKNKDWNIADLNNGAGTLHGVHHLLQSAYGVRWIWPGDSGYFTPKHDSLRVKRRNKHTETPQLLHRYIHENLYHSRGLAYASMHPWFGRDLIQRMGKEEVLWSRRMAQRRDWTYWTRRGHAFTDWWQRFKESHPEYLALQPDGHRESAAGPGTIKLCVSQPKVWDQILDDWEQDDLKPPRLSVSENDGNRGYCTCDTCKSWDAEGAVTTDYLMKEVPSLSDRYVRFASEIANRARERNLEVELAAFAYSQYRAPPISQSVDPSIRIRLVAGEYPSDEALRDELRLSWDDWRAQGATEMFWRPNTLYQGNGLPLVYGSEIAEDIQHLADRGLLGINIDSLGGFWSTWGPTAYVVARQMVEVDTPVAELEAEYYEAFGPASAEVQAYFDHWREVTRELVEPGELRDRFWELRTKQTHYSALYSVSRDLYDAETLAQAEALLSAAEARVPEDDPALKARMQVLRIGLNGVPILFDALEQFMFGTTTTAWLDPAPALPAAKALRAHRKTAAETHAANAPFQSWREGLFGDVTGLLALKDIESFNPIARLPRFLRYRIDPKNEGLDNHWELTLQPQKGWEWVPSRIGSRHTAQSVKWTHDNDHQQYNGPIWYMMQLQRPDFAKGKGHIIYLPMADGDLTAWFNGVPAPVIRKNGQSLGPAYVIWPDETPQNPTFLLRSENNRGSGGLLRPMWLLDQPPW